jgi:hypothetical protein
MRGRKLGRRWTVNLPGVLVVAAGCLARRPTPAPRSGFVPPTELRDTTAHDVIRMATPMHMSLPLAPDSLSYEELDRIRVTVDLPPLTGREFLVRALAAAGLRVEFLDDGARVRITAGEGTGGRDTGGPGGAHHRACEPAAVRFDATVNGESARALLDWAGRVHGATFVIAPGSLSDDELQRVKVTTNLVGVTAREFISTALTGAGLEVEFLGDGTLLRITRARRGDDGE